MNGKDVQEYTTKKQRSLKLHEKDAKKSKNKTKKMFKNERKRCPRIPKMMSKK